MLKRYSFEIVVLVATATIVSWQLFTRPLVGMADNGDFSRFFGAGLDHVPTEFDDKYFKYFNSKYRIVPGRRLGSYLSSTEIPIRISRWVSIPLGGSEFFDIRVLGGLYLLLLLAGLCLFLIAGKPFPFAPRAIAAILFVFVLTDASYVACFDSFFSEATALVFLLLAAGCAMLMITRWKSVWLLLGYFAAAAGLVTCKPMYAPFALLLAPYGVYLARLAKFKRSLLVGGFLAVLLCVTAGVYYSRTPRLLKVCAIYVGLFTDLLHHSTTKEQDLIDLGLNPEWARLEGTSPFAPDSIAMNAEFQSELLGHMRGATLPLFFISRPARFYERFSRCSTRILTMTPLGYYEKSSGLPPYSRPSGPWYRIRSKLVPKSNWTVLIFLGSGLAVTITGMLRRGTQTRRDLFGLYGMLVCVAAAQFFVPALTVGDVDLSRYLNLFNLIFDLSLILGVIAAVSAVLGLIQRRRVTSSESSL